VTKTTKPTAAKATTAQKKHRTGATEKYYIPNYPTKLYIYKLDASKYWWARYFVGRNAVRKSTKTESKQEAIAFAKEFYDVVTYNERHGIAASLQCLSFQQSQRRTRHEAGLRRGNTGVFGVQQSVMLGSAWKYGNT